MKRPSKPSSLAAAVLGGAIWITTGVAFADDDPAASASSHPEESVADGAGQETFVNPIQLDEPLQRPPGDWYVPSEDPESSVPTIEERLADPMKFAYYLMELVDKGKYALDHKDYDTAIQIYRTTVKAVPERAVGWGRLCLAYAGAGKFREAESACGQAVIRPQGSVEDHARYFELVLRNRGGEIPPADLSNLDILIKNLEEQPGLEVPAARLACKLGARLEDAGRLRRCTAVLEEKVPNDLFTLTHRWALASVEGDRDDADEALERAAAAGLAPKSLERMRRSNERLAEKTPWVFLMVALTVAGMLVAGLSLMRRRRGRIAHA